jgi:hypothetical protein
MKIAQPFKAGLRPETNGVPFRDDRIFTCSMAFLSSLAGLLFYMPIIPALKRWAIFRNGT